MMKQATISATVLFITFAFIMSACHSNVNNYRQAYETALQNDRGDLDPTIYNKIRMEAKLAVTIVNGDSIRTRTEALSPVREEGDADRKLQEFNVVIGQYKILFNAKSHRDRLKNMGYDSFILQTGEPLYYVAIGALDSLEEASEIIRKYKKECPGQYVGMDEPMVEIPSQSLLK